MIKFQDTGLKTITEEVLEDGRFFGVGWGEEDHPIFYIKNPIDNSMTIVLEEPLDKDGYSILH